MEHQFRVRPLGQAALIALLATAACDCPRGGVDVTVTNLATVAPSGRPYGVEELRGDPAPTCADLALAMTTGAELPGLIMATQATDRLDAGDLFMADSGDDDWRGCPQGAIVGTFVVWIYDVPVGCDSPVCFPDAPAGMACTEGAIVPADSTMDLVLPAAPFP